MTKKSPLEELLKGHVYPEKAAPKPVHDDVVDEALMHLPLFEEEDREILMHKQVHFSGSFSAMIEYYSNEESKGICDDIDLRRIEELSSIEQKLGIDLAAQLLSEQDVEKVEFFRKMRDDLAAIPESVEASIAEAILSEKHVEEIAGGDIDQLVRKPELLVLLARSDLFSSSLAPGYGAAPALAILLLGRIKYEKAVPDLFLLIGRADFITENAVLWALHEIGPSAKKYAMQKLKGLPITSDNERAALALLEFLPDPEIEKAFLEMSQAPDLPETLKGYLSL